MRKLPASAYEDFKNQPKAENSEEWVSNLFSYMFSDATELPKRASAVNSRDQTILHQLKEQENLVFRFPYFDATFPSFLQYYTTEYKNLYNSMMFEKTSKLKENGVNTVINSLINSTPESALGKLITEGLISKLKEQKELKELYNSYKDKERVIFNEYIHHPSVLIQWRILNNGGKDFSHLLLSYNNFEIKDGENTPAIIRHVLAYGDNKDPEPLPIPWKVKLSKLNYLLILDRRGYFYKLNDFIDNPEFKTVRPLFKINLWELTFNKETMSNTKRLREEYENRIKEQESKQKSYNTLKAQYDKNKKNTSFSGSYVTDPDNGKQVWKNSIEWIKSAESILKAYKGDLENLSLIISELKKEIENGSDGRALPPHISLVKHIDFIESEQEPDTYDFTFYTQQGGIWYGRIKVDILANTVQIIRGGWVTLEPKVESSDNCATFTDAYGISLCNYYDENRDIEYTRLMMLPTDNTYNPSEFRHLFEVQHEDFQYSTTRKYQVSGVNWDTTDTNLIQAQKEWLEEWKGNYGLEAMEKRPKIGYAITTDSQPKSSRKIGVYISETQDYTNRSEWRKFFAHLFLAYRATTRNNRKITFRFELDFLNPQLDRNGEFILNKEHNVKLTKSTESYKNWKAHTLNFSISFTPHQFKTEWLEKFIQVNKLEEYIPQMLVEENYNTIMETVINLVTLKQSDRFKTEYKIKKVAENSNHIMELYLAGVKLLELTLPFSEVETENGYRNSSHTVFRLNNFAIDIPQTTTLINKYKYIEKIPFVLLIKEDSSRAFQLHFIAEQCYENTNISDGRKFIPLKIEDKWIYYVKNPDYNFDLFYFDLSQDNSESQLGREIKQLDYDTVTYSYYDGEEIVKILKISYQNKESFVVIKTDDEDNPEEKGYGIDLFVKSGDRTQSNKWVRLSDANYPKIPCPEPSEVMLAFWEENSVHIVWKGNRVHSTLYNTKPFSIIQNPFLYKYWEDKFQFLADAIEPARFESSNQLISLPIEDVKQIDNKVTAYTYMNESVLNYISNSSIDKQWCLIGNDGVSKLAKFNNKIIKTAQENITFTATIEVNFAYYNAETDAMVSDMETSILLASIFSNSDNLTKIKSNILNFEVWKEENGRKVLKVPSYSINLAECEKTIKNNAVWVRIPLLVAEATAESSVCYLRNFKIGNGKQFRKFSQWNDEIRIESNRELIIKDIIYSLNI